MLTIFIDESGTLPDPKDKFIVICGVGVKKIKEAENIISRALTSLRRRKIRIKENIIIEKIISWPEMKKKSLEQNKKLT